jgi:hypothetical protein
MGKKCFYERSTKLQSVAPQKKEQNYINQNIFKYDIQLNRRHFYMPMHFSLQMAGVDMSVSILFLLLLLLLMLAAVTQAAVELTDSTLTTDQLHTVLCGGPSQTNTSNQEDLSSSRYNAQRRMSPAAISVNLCHRGTICRR